MSATPRNNKGPYIIVGVIALILQISVTASPDDLQIINLNGGFEVSEGELPAGWSAFGPAVHMPVISKAKPHGGSSFLRVPVGPFSAGKMSGVQQFPSASQFKSGDIVTISANIRLKSPLDEGTRVKVAFEMFAPDQKVIGSTGISPQNTPGEWQSVTSSITIPENFGMNSTTKVIANVFCSKAPTQENEVDFDDIVLTIAPASKQKIP